MGRAKLEIKKLEEKTRRQVTYSKRSNGLLKKAYELSVLCDIDIALIMFSQNGKLSLFSGEKRIEEVLARYMNLPLHERESTGSDCNLNDMVGLPKQRVLEDLMKLSSEVDLASQLYGIFQGEPINITSQAEAEYHEHMLLEALGRVNNRRRDLEGVRLGPPNNPTNLHKTRTYFHGESSNANAYLATDSNNTSDQFTQRNHPQSTSHGSSVYSNMMNIIRMNLADQVRLNNANNAEAGENFAEVDNATSRRPETYTAATPAIHPPETSSPNKMKGVGSFIRRNSSVSIYGWEWLESVLVDADPT
ncbi:hypothetical protein AMTRI_Chr09g33490 [Amborella trichopoda]